MMSRSCVLPNCTSSDPSRSYFPFPHNVVLRQLWLEACGLTTITEDQFVCSDHFTVSDFTCSRTKTELLPEAVPNASNLAPPNKATSAYILEHLEHQTDNEFVSDLCGGEESDSPAAKIKPFWKNTDPEAVLSVIVDRKAAIVEEGSDVSEDEGENVPRPKKRKLDESHVSESIQTINNQRIKYFQSDGQLPGDGENVIAYKYSKQPVKRNTGKPKGRAIKIRALQEKHREEVSALKAEIAHLKARVAKHEDIERKWMSHSKRWEKKVAAATEATSKAGRLKVVCDTLLASKFTQNQADLITQKVKRVKEWTKEELAEAFTQWNLGKELYEYQHKHFFERCPMPSVASLINYRDAGPETFHCPHETCVKVFYSKQNLDSHFKEHSDMLCEQCGKGFPNKFRLHSHVRAVHFKFKQWRCKLCEREFEKQENLEIHLAVFHLRLCANDKGYRARRAEFKPIISEYKDKIPFKLIDSQTGIIGEPDYAGNQDAIRLEEVAAFKIEEVVEAGTYKIEEVVHAETVMNSDEVRIGAAKQIIHDHNRLALILPES